MLKYILILFFITSCQHNYGGEKKYQESSSKFERKSENDLIANINNVTIQSNNQDNNNFNVLRYLSHEKKTDSIIAKSIEELNEGQYQSIIDRLTMAIDSEKNKNSKLTEKDIGRKPLRDIYLLLALAYFASNDEKHGQPILDRLILQADKWEPIYLTLCELYLKKNAFILAKIVAQKGIDKLLRPSPDIYIYFARSEISLEHLDAARKILEKTKRLFPNNPEVIGWLGVIDLKTNNVLEACDKFKQSYLLSKSNSSLVYNHIACLIQSQAYEEANAVLQVGLFNANSNPGLYYLGGVLENKQGKKLGAQKYWENYLKLAELSDPRLPYVRASLAVVGQRH